jgi:hypothetical protein
MSATTTKKPISEHAQAAKAIRTKLKTVYPHTVFSVRSKSFSGGDDVSIHWSDGPTTEAVEKIVNVHECGRFDGMIDLYEYTKVHPNVAQVKYVLTQRSHSPETFAALVAHINQRYGYALEIDPKYGGFTRESDKLRGNGSGWQSGDVHRAFYKLSLVCPACKTPTQVPDKFCPECGAALTSDDDE